MKMDVLLLSRLQFAAATMFHFLFVPLTLKIMLVVVIIFVPIVLVYQIWTYNLFKSKVTQEDMVY
jgi:cytochrome d ubiquinol oxidase subunit II